MILTGEPGFHLSHCNNLSGDIVLYYIGQIEKFTKLYFDVPPLLQVEVDVEIDAENITVIGRPSMANKDRIWCTPTFNALFGVKGFENVSAFKIEGAKRKVAAFTEWWCGAGFVQPKLIFASDEEFV